MRKIARVVLGRVAMADMSGKVALVTGAGSGIGRATAEAFAAKGCRVVLAGRREDALGKLASAIRTGGGEAAVARTDVSVAGEVERMVARVIEAFGRLDFAVNNAGIEGQLHPITDLPEEEWDRVLDTNLKGVYLCMKYEGRAMLESGNGGVIVNVGSVNSFLGVATASAYVASKHGMVGLTSSVSAELAPRGIRVNLVCPGIIDTPMHRRLRRLLGDEIYDRAILPTVHLQRAGLPEEIARSIVFLCSEDASYITGTTLTPDGGFLSTI
jgi:NAD(P)-dependent dehydrogenase (short-subunit alcohol dehydrogenase family)